MLIHINAFVLIIFLLFIYMNFMIALYVIAYMENLKNVLHISSMTVCVANIRRILHSILLPLAF